MVLVCHTISQDHVFMWLCRQKLIKVNYDSAKFGGHIQSDSKDIMVIVCHVTLQDHVMKAFNDFVVRRPSRSVTIL